MKKRSIKLKAYSVAILRVYKTQTDRMNEMVRKGRLCEEKLVFAGDAFATLLRDEEFIHLLAAENSLRMPKLFQEWIDATKENTL